MIARKSGLLLIPISTLALGAALSLTSDTYSTVDVPPHHVAGYHPNDWAGQLGYNLPVANHQGTGSCASMACHNADGLKAQAGAELGTWVRHDPHSRAYGVLHDERSKRMVALLNQSDDWQGAKAHEEARCLACHSVEAGANPAICSPWCPPNVSAEADGLGCEACHGPAEHYLEAHSKSWFKGLDRQTKANQYGLYPTDDLAFRSMMCASCHVGSPGRDVDHRLIAAGHPALRWEYTAYHHHPLYTRHWTEKEYGRDFEVRAWVIGQVAAARSSVRLLQQRALQNAGDWPELAEYNCFSCHHNLGGKDTQWRASPGVAQPGFPEWNTWQTPMTLTAVGNLDALEPGLGSPDLQSLRDLRDLLNGFNADRAAVVAQSQSALRDLDALLVALQREADADTFTDPYKASQVQAMLGRLIESAKAGYPADWDFAVQHYLAIAALYHGLTDVSPQSGAPAYREAIRKVRGPIAFPDGYDSPKDRFTPESFRSRLGRFDELRQHLAPLD